jgi:hypothetical protein
LGTVGLNAEKGDRMNRNRMEWSKCLPAFVGIVVAVMLTGCSPDSASKSSEGTSKSKQSAGPLKLGNLWLQKTDTSTLCIVEIENTSAKPIKAFLAKWAILDDLDNVVESGPIEYTSDTSFSPLSEGEATSGHVIASGERICIQTMAVTGEARGEMEMKMAMAGLSRKEGEAMKKKAMEMMGMGTTAYCKEKMEKGISVGMGLVLRPEVLDHIRVTKKIVFKLEKVVHPD